jgi:hypothetical protein
MSDLQIRKVVTVGRREGRRSLAAYESQARGVRLPLSGGNVRSHATGRTDRIARRRGTTAVDPGAALALALVFPFVRRAGRPWGGKLADRVQPETMLPQPDEGCGEGAGRMKRKPSIRNLETVSLDEAIAYLDYANGDELNAACALAWDRNRLDGSHAAPDDAEVHHALFLLCRARGAHAPSYDTMRVERRRRVAA